MSSIQSRLSAPSVLLAATVVSGALAGQALAQPAPPAPAPAAPATTTEAAPADAAVPVAPTATPEPSPVPDVTPEPKKDEKPALEAFYDKGLTFGTADGAFEAKLSLRTQFRFETLRPTEEGAEFQSKFSVNRARLQLDGNVHGKENRYKLELALQDAGSFTFVKDVYVERKVASAWLRVGQWKRPYSRQEITSDFASELNERSIANEFAGGGRDIGIAIHNDYEKSPEGLEWVVGLFNGFAGSGDRPTQTTTTTCSTDAVTGAIRCTSATSRPTNLPGDFGPTLVVRAGWNVGKIKGYAETDIEGGPLRLSIAANYKISFANFAYGSQEEKVDNFSHAAGVDAILKNEGLDVSAGLYLQKLPGADTQYGALLQGGYFITPKVVQVGARFAIHQAPADRELMEARGAFNYYLAGHALKLATDFGFLQLTGENAAGVADDPDLQGRMMVQATF